MALWAEFEITRGEIKRKKIKIRQIPNISGRSIYVKQNFYSYKDRKDYNCKCCCIIISYSLLLLEKFKSFLHVNAPDVSYGNVM